MPVGRLGYSCLTEEQYLDDILLLLGPGVDLAVDVVTAGSRLQLFLVQTQARAHAAGLRATLGPGDTGRPSQGTVTI